MNTEMSKNVRIAEEDENSLRYWAVMLHVTCNDLKEAIRAAGSNIVLRVEEYLKNR